MLLGKCCKSNIDFSQLTIKYFIVADFCIVFINIHEHSSMSFLKGSTNLNFDNSVLIKNIYK